MSVDAEFAAWLGSACLYADASSAERKAAWGDLAAAIESVSPFAYQADADAEAARQLTLFGAPMVVEILTVPGLRIDLIGRPVELRARAAGYEAGATVFVLGVREMDRAERTSLTVLRKLA